MRPGEDGDRTEISGVIQDRVAFTGGRGKFAEACSFRTCRFCSLIALEAESSQGSARAQHAFLGLSSSHDVLCIQTVFLSCEFKD